MSPAGPSWPRSGPRLRERPRALAALLAVTLVLIAGGILAGLAIGGSGPARRDHRTERGLARAAQRSAGETVAARAQAAALRTRNRRLGARVSVLRKRKDYWKRRYAALRRRR